MKRYNTDPRPNYFGSALRKTREGVGLSLRRIADSSGISPTFLSDIEHGRRMPSREIVGKLAAAMELPASDLLKLDPRESLDEIVPEVLASPETGVALAAVCRRLRDGKISRRELNRFAGCKGG
jgi:transcriptional regulator with XRE-family HTH domain